ncbi:MAG: dehydrogenase [Thermobacillus sp. ZCTH02-B1]|uniref:Gfo/Idh/MocA family protein n=1 Tax=Thermobacillus sp. ZCTH02-B1 TaxID=1858795 RepID=UPI000B57EFBB|nr:Gfo/Idh/MocA family oxidoreductase [Thermobacillus sp. ZCTH02-B1]OUM96576.1 MAG: dehydrogenase [Thermobacillus sp. ZCTH02-B1]
MAERAIKWGIMGTGSISGLFAADLKKVEGAELVAVGSRSRERAERFAAEHGAKRAYGSCGELAADPEVDIVYVGTIHPAHRDNMLALIRGGKAVLCEKPFTMNAKQAEEVIREARARGVFLMEAMWTRWLPPIVKVREWLREGKIGDVVMMTADFGFDAGWNPEGRLLNKELGGGALLDAGIYPVSFASMVFGGQPKRIASAARIGETDVDEHFAALFEYDGGRIAQVAAAVRLKTATEAVLYGTKGQIRIPDFLWTKTATLLVYGEEPVTFTDDRDTRGYNFEAMEAMRCLREGRKESDVMPLDETLAVMRTLDAIRAQWNLVYPYAD